MLSGLNNLHWQQPYNPFKQTRNSAALVSDVNCPPVNSGVRRTSFATGAVVELSAALRRYGLKEVMKEMYCSSCGASITQGLSYCNHCGAKLNGEKGDSLVRTTELRAESLIISAMVGLFVLGLLAISVLVGVLKAVLGLNAGQILGFAILSFLIMLLIEGVLISRLPRRKRGAEATNDAALPKELTTKELDAARAGALPDAMPSVTEHTTRTLEPSYSERKSK